MAKPKAEIVQPSDNELRSDIIGDKTSLMEPESPQIKLAGNMENDTLLQYLMKIDEGNTKILNELDSFKESMVIKDAKLITLAKTVNTLNEQFSEFCKKADIYIGADINIPTEVSSSIARPLFGGDDTSSSDDDSDTSYSYKAGEHLVDKKTDINIRKDDNKDEFKEDSVGLIKKSLDVTNKYNSDILNNDFKSILLDMLEIRFKGKVTLIREYSGINDGFYSMNFIDKLKTEYNSYGVITIIKNEYGNIFGGFTKKQWFNDNKFVSDSSAFLFKLYPNIKIFSIKRNIRNKINTVYHSTQYICAFGSKANDLVICNECDNNKYSCSSPYMYEMIYGSELVGGTKNTKRVNFRVINMEAFQVLM